MEGERLSSLFDKMSKDESCRGADTFLYDFNDLLRTTNWGASDLARIVETYIEEELGEKSKVLTSKHIALIIKYFNDFYNSIQSIRFLGEALQSAINFSTRIREFSLQLPSPKKDLFDGTVKKLKLTITVKEQQSCVVFIGQSLGILDVLLIFGSLLGMLIFCVLLFHLWKTRRRNRRGPNKIQKKRKKSPILKKLRTKTSFWANFKWRRNEANTTMVDGLTMKIDEKRYIEAPFLLTPPPTPPEMKPIKETHDFPLLECVCCSEMFTFEKENAFELECNYKAPKFFAHEECFKKALSEQGLNGSKRKKWKMAKCVENDCEGHLIFINPIKKGGIKDKPIYCN